MLLSSYDMIVPVYAGDDTASFVVSSENIEEFGVVLCRCEECCCSVEVLLYLTLPGASQVDTYSYSYRQFPDTLLKYFYFQKSNKKKNRRTFILL